MEITFDSAEARLGHDTLRLFGEMVDAYLGAERGERIFFRTDSLAGTGMILATQGGTTRSWSDFDGGALEDLVDYGLLRQGHGGRGTPTYRIPADGIRFHKWLKQRQGRAVDQVEGSVTSFLQSEEFAEAHPGAVHHLNEAFSLLWEGRVDQQIISEVGDHLRKAIMDTVDDILGSQHGRSEQPVKQLTSWLSQQGEIGSREAEVLGRLIDLTEAVLRLDHRLNHVRDEADKGEPPPSWSELRRAAFLTAVTCHELARI